MGRLWRRRRRPSHEREVALERGVGEARADEVVAQRCEGLPEAPGGASRARAYEVGYELEDGRHDARVAVGAAYVWGPEAEAKGVSTC